MTEFMAVSYDYCSLVNTLCNAMQYVHYFNGKINNIYLQWYSRTFYNELVSVKTVMPTSPLQTTMDGADYCVETQFLEKKNCRSPNNTFPYER